MTERAAPAAPESATPGDAGALAGAVVDAPPEPVVDTRHVSIVMPTYNRRESLRRCLEHLLACDIEGMEVDLRIVDDGSGDGTAELVESLRARAGNSLRIHYCRQANAGASAARNRGIAASGTDVILFIDDDCAPEPGWVRHLASGPWTPGTGAVAGRLISAEMRSLVGRFFSFIQYDEFPVASRGRHDLERISVLNTANCAYLRRALEEAGGFESAFSGGGEDIDLTERVIALGYRIGYQPEARVRHHHRESLRSMVRGFYVRGYRSCFRRVAKGQVPPVTAGRFARKLHGLAGRVLRLALLPVEAARIRRQGAPLRDALPFAFLDWLRMTARTAGETCFMLRLLRGQEKLPDLTKRSEPTRRR